MELLECMVMFNKNIQIDHVILYPHQKKYKSFADLSHPSQHLLSVFLIMAVLLGME